MRLTYTHLARQAIALEKKQSFSEASHIWHQAKKCASEKDAGWAETRADFCACAAKRKLNSRSS